jgi:hypothetical protein
MFRPIILPSHLPVYGPVWISKSLRGHAGIIVLFKYVRYLTANIRVLALLVAHFPSSKWLLV